MSEIKIVDLSQDEDPADYLAESKSLVARLVARLAERGLIPTTLSVRDFFDDCGDFEIALFDGVTAWLLDEGVIRQTDAAIGDDEDERIVWKTLVLTSFGFGSLDRKLDGGLTLGEAMKSASSSNRSDRSWSSVGDLIGGVLGGFTKSLGSG
ncbi:hypothetical protein [Paracoccus sp. (in: a-proteobacteria)]|uniref:hypothetical protein n=1 Tax=Paracoccus sp. TaxID=267 RepID=UPI0026E102A0|nr:hypothetical protein [Paracoccus sp. (in: a-proteobacteria)]MDO5370823.1 hypothetical protein [Paracoccus sp. (in: a-proteobacteria)]